MCLRASLLTLALLLACGCRLSRQEDEKYIKDSEVAWAESVATGDDSVIKRILADDVVWVVDGEVWNKAQAIADAQTGKGDFLYDHTDEIQVRIFGNMAVAQGSESWERTKPQPHKGRFIWTDTWLRRGGTWQIVQAQDMTASPLAAEGIH